MASPTTRTGRLDRLVAAAAAIAAVVMMSYYIADRDEPPRQLTYRTVGVHDGEMLNVRTGPGTSNSVRFAVTAPLGGIVRLDGTVRVGRWDWWHVRLRDGRVGWVNAAFLTPE